jgi:CubicO group peptidase (beta-lactamase class C family)
MGAILSASLGAGAAALLAAMPAPVPGDSLAEALMRAQSGGFEGQIAAADRGAIVFNRTTDGKTPPPRWIWGSVSKQVAAVLTMTEVERGRLSLDDTVARWLPQFMNAETGQATIRDLLQHTSGLANPDGDTPEGTLPPFYARSGRGVGGPGDALGPCAGPAVGARGTFRYNNCDTIVLAAILKRSSGRTFAGLLASRIARPLKLRSVRLARGGERVNEGADPRVNIAAYGAAGALVGSAEDLLRLDQALLGGRLLRQESLDALWRGEPRLGYVALGAWEFRAPLRGCPQPVRLVERRGSVAGVQSRNIIAPELGKALVAFTVKGDFDFGEIWRGSGPGYDLASAAFCRPEP